MPLHEVEAPRTAGKSDAAVMELRVFRNIWKRRGWLLLRFLATAVIFFLLWQRYRRLEAGLALDTLAPGWMVLSVAVMFGRTIFGAWRWKLLLAGVDLHVKLGRLYRLTLESQFVGLVLPGSLSGADVFKVFQLGGDLNKRAETAATVALARLHGLISFILLAVVGAMMHWLRGGSPVFVFATAGFLSVVLAGHWLIWHHTEWLRKMVSQKLNGTGAVARFFNTFLTCNLDRRLWWKSFLLSLCFQFGIIAVYWLTAKAAALPVNWMQCLFAVPLSSIVALLPVTPSGFGLREGSGTVLFHLVGLPEADALRLMLLVMVQLLAYIAIGGVLFALHTQNSQTEGRLDADHETSH